MRKLFLIIVTAYLSGTIWGGCAKQKKPELLAQVGNEKINFEDFGPRVISSIRLAEDIPYDTIYNQTRAFLNNLVEERLLVKGAYEAGLENDEEIKLLMDRQSPRLLLDLLYKKEILDKSQPKEAQIKDFYKKIQTELHLEQILVLDEKTAQEVQQKLKNKENFEKLAAQHSIDFNPEKGADIGFVSVGRTSLPEDVLEAAYKLKVGEFSEPLKSLSGWYILKLLEKKQITPVPDYAESKENIKKRLEYSLQRQALNSYLENLKRKIKLELDQATYTLMMQKDKQIAQADTTGMKRFPGGYLTPELFSDAEKNRILATYKNGQYLLGHFLQDVAELPLARRGNWDDQDQFKHLIFQALMPKALEEEALKSGLDKSSEFKKNIKIIKEKVMADKMKNSVLVRQISTSQDSVRAYFQAHMSDFAIPASYQISEILIGTEKEAQALISQLKRGSNFSRLAAEKTTRNEVKNKNGDLGFITREQYPELCEAASKMKMGEISSPIFNSAGYSIIKLRAIKPAQMRTFEEANVEVQGKYFQDKLEEVYQKWLSQMKERFKITVFEDNLKQRVQMEMEEGRRLMMPPATPSSQRKKR